MSPRPAAGAGAGGSPEDHGEAAEGAPADGMGASTPIDDPRLQAGIEHLQRAAHEVIAASRALLDVAEELIDDPRAASSVVDALGSLGGLARSRAAGLAGRRPGAATGTTDDPDDPPVQRIPVS